jgi:hypothetical protein
MRTITIEIDEDKGYTVREGDRYHDQLCWDEMLGQIAQLTHPQLGAARYQMRTEAEWAEYSKRFEPKRERAPDDAPVLLLTHQQQ